MVLKENVDLECMVDLQSASADHKEFNFTVSSVVAGVWETHASGNIQVSEGKKGKLRNVKFFQSYISDSCYSHFFLL